MLLRCYTQHARKFGKLSSGHRTGKDQFSFQYQRRTMPKNVQTTIQFAFISHTSKVILKILQARLQQYVNKELPDVQAEFWRAKRNQRSNYQHPLNHRKSKRVPEKHVFLFHWLCQSVWLYGSIKQWKILKEMGIPDHLTCLLRNLYASQEATVRTGHGTTDWFQIGKGVCQGCILSPCLFNLYAEYIMRNAGLEEAQAGIIARRNIDNQICR